MNTALARADIVFANGNNILLSDFTVDTSTSMCDSVYLNTKTYGRLTDCSADVNFKTDTTGYDNKAAPAGIILRFVVCGNEVMTLSAAGAAYLEHYLTNAGAG